MLRTESPLPGILRWFPVVSAARELVSPVQHGCETVSAANEQLRQLVVQFSPPGEEVNISPLSMRLQVRGEGSTMSAVYIDLWGGRFHSDGLDTGASVKRRHDDKCVGSNS